VVARVFQTLSLVGVLVLALFLIKESWESILQRLQQKGLMEVAQLMNIPHQEDEHWNRQSQKNLMGILFLASVVPCPGTLLVLVFSFSLQAHALGILAALGISLGVGLVLGLISLFTILAQRQGKKLIKQGSLETLAGLVQMGAALLLTLTSLTLLT
jgi:ABC-type nickel/cobalt efflux system permease component RcnA